MCLRRSSGDAAKGQPTVDRYIYGRILGIFHVNVIYAGPGRLDYSKRRFDFVWIRWFGSLSAAQPWSSKRLDRVALKSLADGAACGFVDPADIVRAAHIIPRFSLGTVVDEWKRVEALKAKSKRPPPTRIFSKLAHDEKDWREYYVNRWVSIDFIPG